MANPNQQPQGQGSSKPELPQVVQLELTYEGYQAVKEARLKQVPSVARSHINTYFEWLKSIRPEEVVDAITQNITVEQAYKTAPFPMRIGIAAARGFLKVAKKYQEQLKQIASYDLAITTLKYENPQTYAIIQRYGKQGEQFVRDWIRGALKVLGVTTN